MYKKKSNAGRKTVKTSEVIRKIEEIAALDGSVEEMASYADIHMSTIYKWMEEDPELKERIFRLRQKPVLKARRTFVSALDDPDKAIEYLERKRKEEFSKRKELTGAGGSDLIPEPIINVPRNNSNAKNTGNDKENQSRSGGNVSK